MKIHVTDIGDLGDVGSIADSINFIGRSNDMGLQYVYSSTGNSFNVLDEKEFMIAIVKYGIKWEIA